MDYRYSPRSYGTTDRFTDVRELLQSRVQNDRLDFKVTNASMGGDPAKSKKKTLLLNYGWDGRTYEVTAAENQQVSIPTEAQQQTQTGTSSGTQPEWPSNRSTRF